MSPMRCAFPVTKSAESEVHENGSHSESSSRGSYSISRKTVSDSPFSRVRIIGSFSPVYAGLCKFVVRPTFGGFGWTLKLAATNRRAEH